jgi:3-hydroxyacyl-CoA dehydrogenase/enoyl-CoA hydratase/3-hydroxybutyryl-CoA epimerase
MPNLRTETLDDGICVLTFDRPDSSANVFDAATLVELDAAIDRLAKAETQTTGLILTSAKATIFVAGADLRGVQTMSAEQMTAFIALGQTVFGKIAALSFPSVAAVHGAAVGGGYEVCLACDWRVASPDACTKLGLPETKLGLIPAWGGSTRLPRMLSVPAALDIILGGKTVSARHALKLGLIDEVAPREHLVAAARAFLKRGKHPRTFAHSATVNAVVDAFIAPKARHAVMAKTHGHYPAVQKALEVVLRGSASSDEAASLQLEREAITELVALDSTKNLLRLFFLQERAKKITAPTTESPGSAAPCRRAAVIGAGVMGAGIAQWISSRGMRVTLRDVDAARVAAGMGTVEALYAAGVQHRTFTKREARAGLDRVSPAPSEVPLGNADIVIEAAVEKMEVKKVIFRRLDELVGDDAILATNTSALSITELAAATRHPRRVVGLHFFNPVHKMQLVEVVVGRDTAPEIARRALRFAQQIGKLPVLVKDSPGFLVNRILIPYLIEAGALFWNGANVQDIDEAMLDFGMPMGPLRLIDEVGTDIALDVATTLAAAFSNHLQVPDVLPAMVGAGLLGRKAGKGFYRHGNKGAVTPNKDAARLRPPRLPSPPSSDELRQRMVLLMVNEAARCLEEGIVGTPGDVDFAMVMGTGFAPFRGGPLRYADSVGTVKIVEELSRLADVAGPHYAASARLRDMAKTGRCFYES